ncbi:MAG TPA: ChaN family lipoprotein [Flavobacteriales bacterium]|nr:ChaN family lipoprotein [Flavobacteriales bacterium]
MRHTASRYSCTFHRNALILLLALSTSVARGQLLPNYALFDARGKALSHKQVLRSIASADVVLFGELHNNPIAHWLQLVVARDLAARGPVVFGAEMIEADDQITLDRYLRGEIDQAAFDTLARLWENHATDYAPLVDLAKEKKFPFVACNVPRRYARAVSQGGFEALDTVPSPQRAWIAPLPIDFDPNLPGYVKMLEMMGDHASPNMAKAQALKDATMAHFISRYAKPGVRFLHFNGSYHSDNHEGIGWYLQRTRPELKRVTIATVTQEQLKHLDPGNLDRADIILCVDAAVPGSY